MPCTSFSRGRCLMMANGCMVEAAHTCAGSLRCMHMQAHEQIRARTSAGCVDMTCLQGALRCYIHNCTLVRVLSLPSCRGSQQRPRIQNPWPASSAPPSPSSSCSLQVKPQRLLHVASHTRTDVAGCIRHCINSRRNGLERACPSSSVLPRRHARLRC
jgi:hypothetical protein